VSIRRERVNDLIRLVKNESSRYDSITNKQRTSQEVDNSVRSSILRSTPPRRESQLRKTIPTTHRQYDTPHVDNETHLIRPAIPTATPPNPKIITDRSVDVELPKVHVDSTANNGVASNNAIVTYPDILWYFQYFFAATGPPRILVRGA
jgi:hypothetical protein